jgi:transcriptional regulator with XRE-family HTH domain
MRLDGKVIRRLREDAGLTIRDLADQAQISKSHIFDLEKELKSVTPRTAARLAKALEVSIATLRGRFG